MPHPRRRRSREMRSRTTTALAAAAAAAAAILLLSRAPGEAFSPPRRAGRTARGAPPAAKAVVGAASRAARRRWGPAPPLARRGTLLGRRNASPNDDEEDDGKEKEESAGTAAATEASSPSSPGESSDASLTSGLSSLAESDEERSLKRNEAKLKKHLKEVKEAAKDVAKSAEALKDKIADKAGGEVPSILPPDDDVRDAVANVTESAGKLGGKIIDKGPSILARVFLGLFSKEIREDFKRRRAVYFSDWTDAFGNKRQMIPAILFLYFACLAPAVSFGTIASELTNGSIGVVEFLLSSGCSGMVYAMLCGQPMAFIAPTGLTLAFISGLFRFCSLKGIPFFPVYTWVGLWTSLFMVSLGMVGSSRFIRYCTRFTDEVFNGLLSINFIYEAASSLRRNFRDAPDPSNLTMPFVALSMALTTYYSTLKATKFQTSKFFNHRIRTLVKDFGPVSILAGMSVLNALPSVKRFAVPTLGVPNSFQLSGGREFLIPLTSVSWSVRALCALPAVLLTALFFMDQNISVRVVNNPDNKLKKGSAYNLDMVALGLVTAGLSIFGLPWMCGATVQSLNHLRAMTITKFNEETEKLEIESVTETRFTGFTIHALIFATIRALPLLSYLPIPVVSGVFLFLGRKLLTGNSFMERIGDGLAERKRLPRDHPVHVLGRRKMNVFTSLQVLCLLGLWTFKQNTSTAIFFPSVIGMLMVIRSFVLPKFFSEEELVALGDPSP